MIAEPLRLLEAGMSGPPRVLRVSCEAGRDTGLSTEDIVARGLSLLLAGPAPRLRLELPAAFIEDGGVLARLEKAVASETSRGRQLAIALHAGKDFRLSEPLCPRVEDLGARVVLQASPRSPAELIETARELRRLRAAGVVAVVEAELLPEGLGEWLARLEELAPARLRLRLGAGARWGARAARLDAELAEWIGRLERRAAGRSVGLEIENLSEREEPDLLSSELAVDARGRAHWATSLRHGDVWPEFGGSEAPGLESLDSLERLFLAAPARHRWACERLKGEGLSLWLDNAAAALKLHSFFQNSDRGFNDRSEGTAIRRGVLQARLPDQDRFLRLYLPELDCAYYQIHTACLHDCVFCRHKDEGDSGPRQRLEEIRSFLSANMRLRRRRIALVGNEPLLHPEILEIVRECRRSGFEEVEILTSGNPLEDPALVGALKEAGATAFSIPLHSADPAEHDAITRRAGSFSAVVRAVENIRRAGGLKIYLHANAVRGNLRSLPALERLAASWGAPFSVLALRPKEPENMNEAYEHLEPSYRDLSGLAESVLVGFPVCVARRVQGDRPPRREAVSESIKLYTLNKNFVKPAACRDCADSPRCTGTSREHLDLYPGDEALLRPSADEARL